MPARWREPWFRRKKTSISDDATLCGSTDGSQSRISRLFRGGTSRSSVRKGYVKWPTLDEKDETGGGMASLGQTSRRRRISPGLCGFYGEKDMGGWFDDDDKYSEKDIESSRSSVQQPQTRRTSGLSALQSGDQGWSRSISKSRPISNTKDDDDRESLRSQPPSRSQTKNTESSGMRDMISKTGFGRMISRRTLGLSALQSGSRGWSWSRPESRPTSSTEDDDDKYSEKDIESSRSSVQQPQTRRTSGLSALQSGSRGWSRSIPESSPISNTKDDDDRELLRSQPPSRSQTRNTESKGQGKRGMRDMISKTGFGRKISRHSSRADTGVHRSLSVSSEDSEDSRRDRGWFRGRTSRRRRLDTRQSSTRRERDIRDFLSAKSEADELGEADDTTTDPAPADPVSADHTDRDGEQVESTAPPGPDMNRRPLRRADDGTSYLPYRPGVSTIHGGSRELSERVYPSEDPPVDPSVNPPVDPPVDHSPPPSPVQPQATSESEERGPMRIHRYLQSASELATSGVKSGYTGAKRCYQSDRQNGKGFLESSRHATSRFAKDWGKGTLRTLFSDDYEELSKASRSIVGRPRPLADPGHVFEPLTPAQESEKLSLADFIRKDEVRSYRQNLIQRVALTRATQDQTDGSYSIWSRMRGEEHPAMKRARAEKKKDFDRKYGPYMTSQPAASSDSGDHWPKSMADVDSMTAGFVSNWTKRQQELKIPVPYALTREVVKDENEKEDRGLVEETISLPATFHDNNDSAIDLRIDLGIDSDNAYYRAIRSAAVTASAATKKECNLSQSLSRTVTFLDSTQANGQQDPKLQQVSKSLKKLSTWADLGERNNQRSHHRALGAAIQTGRENLSKLAESIGDDDGKKKRLKSAAELLARAKGVYFTDTQVDNGETVTNPATVTNLSTRSSF